MCSKQLIFSIVANQRRSVCSDNTNFQRNSILGVSSYYIFRDRRKHTQEKWMDVLFISLPFGWQWFGCCAGFLFVLFMLCIRFCIAIFMSHADSSLCSLHGRFSLLKPYAEEQRRGGRRRVDISGAHGLFAESYHGQC